VATTEIDASGRLVTPGFVDLHTHLDAQIGWDPLMTSSSWQGVTTTLIGNCGVTFAPVRPDSAAYLAEMMESVEDIPRDAILDGLPWDWESYPGYLDSLDRMGPALNVVGLVGHCAIRHHVMGERALTDYQPTPADLAALREAVAESVDGGAVGYSTSRILLHVVPDGRKVPGTYATTDEHLAMADGMADAGGGLFQAVLDFETRAGEELRLLTTMAERARGVLFAAGPGNDEAVGAGVGEFWHRFLCDTRDAAGPITAYTMTRPSGTLTGLAQVLPVASREWVELLELPTIEDRVAALEAAPTRARLVEAGQAKGLWYDPQHIYPLGPGPVPDWGVDDATSVAELAEAAGVHPVELMIDRLVESEGRELFNVWFFHRNREGLGALLALDEVYPGAGDTGAHAGQICDADAPTHFLSYWCRDRGLVSLPEAVNRLTGRPAQTLGLVDRGTLRVGAFADLNVIDLEHLAGGYPTYVRDLPGGAGRFTVGATGYVATLVNGRIVAEQGEHTGVRPGRVLRDFAR
jgi:N-acyl-D-aspartate/D-glutamate deacylase